MDLGLRDKTAVITGGSSGIGLCVGRALAQEGVHVLLCSRDGALLERECADITKTFGTRAVPVAADVAKAQDIDRVVASAEQAFGGADIVVNNAGTGTRETIAEAPDSRWQYYWDLHLMAAVRLSRGLLPSMRRRGGGVILNNASICATQPMSHAPIYAVTKAALVMFSKCLANEVIKDNIRVNCINPGLIQTAGWEDPIRKRAAETGSDWRADLDAIARKHAPIGRFATPQELADFFVFLCSPRASYCVGSTYYVDGGWLNVVT